MVDRRTQQTMEIIIPAAGQSTRFPNMRPKYLLMSYHGKLMIELAIGQHLGQHKIYVGVLKEHADCYHVRETFAELFGDKVNLVILPEKTQGPADTVAQIIKIAGIDNDTSILIKDCDSFYNSNINLSGNTILVDSLVNNPDIRMAASKSYLGVNDQGIVNNIIEKKIISEWFCVGGYKFDSVQNYLTIADQLLSASHTEVYISAVIDKMLNSGQVFTTTSVTDWVDVGTKDDWYRYNSRPSIFCDIDGTIIVNQGQYGDNNFDQDAVPLTNNIAALHKAQLAGCQIIFTTARPSAVQTQTRKMLDQLGFGNCQLIMDMHHSQRIVINDYAPTNPYPSALAINLPRNSDTLSDQLPLAKIIC